jgi:hypothetical protein
MPLQDHAQVNYFHFPTAVDQFVVRGDPRPVLAFRKARELLSGRRVGLEPRKSNGSRHFFRDRTEKYVIAITVVVRVKKFLEQSASRFDREQSGRISGPLCSS